MQVGHGPVHPLCTARAQRAKHPPKLASSELSGWTTPLPSPCCSSASPYSFAPWHALKLHVLDKAARMTPHGSSQQSTTAVPMAHYKYGLGKQPPLGVCLSQTRLADRQRARSGAARTSVECVKSTGSEAEAGGACKSGCQSGYWQLEKRCGDKVWWLKNGRRAVGGGGTEALGGGQTYTRGTRTTSSAFKDSSPCHRAPGTQGTLVS